MPMPIAVPPPTQPRQPCAAALAAVTVPARIESCVGSGYCNQDRERGLRRVVYTGHCCVSGNRQKELPFQVEPRLASVQENASDASGGRICGREGSQQLPGGFAAASFAALYNAQEQTEGIDGPSCR